MMTDVARELMVAATKIGDRASLGRDSDASYGDSMAKLAQALSHAVQLLEEHDVGSYEVHVALRTVRTIETAERIQPSRATSWGMDGTKRTHVLNNSYCRMNGDVTPEQNKQSIPAASNSSSSPALDAKKTSKISDEIRQKINRAYQYPKVRNDNRERKNEPKLEPPAKQVPLRESSPAAKRQHRRDRWQRAKRESVAQRTKDELQRTGELTARAREHQAALRNRDILKHRRHIILLGSHPQRERDDVHR